MFKFLDSNTSDSAEGGVADKIPQLLHAYAKYLLKMEPGDRVRPNLETLLRNAVRAFPYHQSLLFQALVKSIATTKFGEPPNAYIHIVQSLFGQRMATTTHFCSVCGVCDARKRCKACKLAYCSVECQKFDWPIHKRCCESLLRTVAEENALRQASIQYIEETPIGGGAGGHGGDEGEATTSGPGNQLEATGGGEDDGVDRRTKTTKPEDVCIDVSNLTLHDDSATKSTNKT